MPAAALATALTLAAVAGCDQGYQNDEPRVTGPPLTAAIANVTAKGTLPVNQPIVLQFNRYLNPFTVTRQNVRLQNVNGVAITDPVIDYDPVLLQVTLSKPEDIAGWLVEGQNYVIDMPAALSAAGGVQAVDNATLVAETKLAFTVGPAGVSPSEPTMHFCTDVWPFFDGPRYLVSAKSCVTPTHHGACSNANCHGAPQTVYQLCSDGAVFDLDAGDFRFPTGQSEPAEGLVLDSPAYVQQTAIGRIANESNVGAQAGAGAPGSQFGIQMPIIDPGTLGTGDPANSWLLYKVLLAAPISDADDELLIPPVQCGALQTNETFQAGVSDNTTIAERLRLGEFIPGREMPYPNADDAGEPPTADMAGGTLGSQALSVRQRERLRLWIKQGAKFDDFSLPGGKRTQDCSQVCRDLPR